MRFSTVVLPVLPALALAAPQIQARDGVDCSNPNGDYEQAYCGLIGLGLATPAASYLASEVLSPDLSTALDAIETQPAVAALVTSLFGGTGTVIPTGVGNIVLTALGGQATAVATGSLAAEISSVFAHAMQLDGAAATATGSSGSGSSKPSGSSGSGSGSGSGSSGSGSQSASGSGAGASVSKTAGAPMATSFGFAAAAVAGVVGLAVGL